ncbi:TonB-dependent receptor plug domain-containing protein [Flavobacterium flavipallidum]|uniref:TonB-dependent receptor plug domain-containing protein n=1 Tax=Flavobacterium flavipallidum TaxID=3139140 RepID=A0ABU9HMZ9_9FLAO
MNKKIVRISALIVMISTSVLAQKKGLVLSGSNELEEVVISDSKFALPKEKSGKVIVKITAEDLKKRPGQSIASVLSTVAGVEVNGNQSSAGKNQSYYIRGGRNRQTLILIDGIPLTDASGINFDYDLRLIPVDQVESIEIMKGAASTLYGTGAATGVINITLKKAAKKAIAGNVYMNVGTQTTAKDKDYSAQEYNQGFSFNGKTEKFNYFASLNSTETTGISEAKAPNNEKFEDDSFSRVNGLVKLGFTPTKKLSLDFFANYDRLKNDFDYGAFADDANNYGKSEQYRVGFSPKYKYNKGELVVNTAANLMNRDLFQYGGLTKYKSRNVSADAFNKYQILSDLFVVTGAQFQFFDMSIHDLYTNITNEMATFNLIDPYVTAVYNSNFGLNINAGARLNIHSKYGNHIVYNINPSYQFEKLPLKIISSYSTAYIAPSLYQLYASYGGNVNLDAEENSTVEAGFEVAFLNKKLVLNSIAFYRQEKSAIEYGTAYFNADGKYNSKGIETSFSYAINNKVNLNANYTFTQTEDKIVNNTFPDIRANLYNPKHKVNAAVDYQFVPRAFVGVSYQYLDKRDGFVGYPPVVSVMDSYQLVNATAKYELIKNRMTVFASATNIFNVDFIEVLGYNTRGRNFKLGLNINL